ncbi:hypothetical protein [Streptomyces sp. NPDC001502]|uniref:hypothetical protein n=1 Tax=Streptomyces sp. NPDC001502 TaxID=3364578 RepID=UPI0036AE3208
MGLSKGIIQPSTGGCGNNPEECVSVMRRRKFPVAVLAVAALLGEMFSAYATFSAFYRPGMERSIGWIAAAFSLSLLLSVILAVRGVTLIGPASFVAVGLGILASGIERGETINAVMGAVCLAAGLSSMFLMVRFSHFSLDTPWGLGVVAGAEPRECHTRLCRLPDLDERLLPLLEDTVHRYSLGELRAATRLCCETRYSDNGVFQRGAYVGAVPLIEACILTETLVLIAIIHTEGHGVALVGRLQQTMVSGLSDREAGAGEHGIHVRSAWLGSAEASSYPFPLDGGAAGEEFMEEFRELLTAARHT